MIQQAEVRAYKIKPMSPEVQTKVDLSYSESIGLAERELRCPHCERYIATLFADSGGHFKVKCSNCKSITVFNLGYFRRSHRYPAIRMGNSHQMLRYTTR